MTDSEEDMPVVSDNLKRRATLEGLYLLFTFLSFYVDYGPMADIPRNKVCAFENITAIHCIRQRQGKRFHTVPNATIFDLYGHVILSLIATDII